MSNLTRRAFLKNSALKVCAMGLVGTMPGCRSTKPVPPLTLWQMPCSKLAEMGYVIQTPRQELIVIDGGAPQATPFLRSFLQERGGHVHAWFISHPHFDHVGVLTEILQKPEGIRIDAMYASLPELDWIAQNDPADTFAIGALFGLHLALMEAGQKVQELSIGQKFAFEQTGIEILAVRNPELRHNAVNNQSVVFRLNGPHASVLFLADLGIEGGKKLLASPMRDKLRTDYVQMAHHGQNGVGREVYAAIQPSACLWPTPGWLWDNDRGGGLGTGTWQTLEVRAWMDELGVKRHYVAKDGLCRIEL